MARDAHIRAVSRYKQMRLNFTEEAGGLLSCSLYVKPLNAEWTERQCVFRWTERDMPSVESLEDAIIVAHEVLARWLVPGTE
jgi:hypothetical protein